MISFAVLGQLLVFYHSSTPHSIASVILALLLCWGPFLGPQLKLLLEGSIHLITLLLVSSSFAWGLHSANYLCYLLLCWGPLKGPQLKLLLLQLGLGVGCSSILITRVLPRDILTQMGPFWKGFSQEAYFPHGKGLLIGLHLQTKGGTLWICFLVYFC